MSAHKISFFEQVSRNFDKAAAFTPHHPTLLEQIKACNAVYRMSFPLRRDDGTMEVIHAWRAEHSHHKLPTKGGILFARDVNEEARDQVRVIMKTEAYQVSSRQRKIIETGFGDLKQNLGLTRLRLRGLTGASDEFLLAATVQNLRRLARSIWPPETSPKPGMA